MHSKENEKFYQSRKEHIDKLTESITVNINVYIDGHNFFLNLKEDLQGFLDIFEHSYQAYHLTRDFNFSMDEDQIEDDELFVNPQFDFLFNSKKLAKLGSWYLKNNLEQAIQENIKEKNVNFLFGDLDKDKKNILYPNDILSYVYYYKGINLRYLTWILSDKLEMSKFGLAATNNQKLTNFFLEELKLIPETKNLEILNKTSNIFEFLNKNKQIREELLNRFTSLDKLEALKEKIQIKLNFNYHIYRADINIPQNKSYLKKRLTDYNLHPNTRSYFEKNLKLLDEGKVILSIHHPQRISDIKTVKDFFALLKESLDTNEKFGKIKWNNIKGIEEKGVDTRLTLDIQKDMLLNKADLFCIITNDTDFYPVLEEAKEQKKFLFYCSVVPKNRISSELRKSSNLNDFIFPKKLDFNSLKYVLWPNESFFMDNFIRLIDDIEYRKKIHQKLKKNAEEKIKKFKLLEQNFVSLNKALDELKKSRFGE